MSSLDVSSFDMSSVGGFSKSSNFGQSNMSGMSGLISTGSQASRGGASAARRKKSSLEQKLEKVNAAHRRQQARHAEREHHDEDATKPSNAHSSQDLMKESLLSIGFDPIDEHHSPSSASHNGSKMSMGNSFASIASVGIKAEDDVGGDRFAAYRELAVQRERSRGSMAGAASFNNARLEASALPVHYSRALHQSMDGAYSIPVSQLVVNKRGEGKHIRKQPAGEPSSPQGFEESFSSSFMSLEVDGRQTPQSPKDIEATKNGNRQQSAGGSSQRSGKQGVPSRNMQSHNARVAPESNVGDYTEGGTPGDPIMDAFGTSMTSMLSIQSQSSAASSWLHSYNKMGSIDSDTNPWDDEDSHGSSAKSDISAPRMVAVDMSGREVEGL